MMPAEQLPERLDDRFSVLVGRIADTASACGRKLPKGHGDNYMACCPAHDDHSPSLSLKIEGPRILINCFAGCSAEDVCGAVGFPMEALFDDYRQNGKQPWPVRLGKTREQRVELRRRAEDWATSVHEPAPRLPLPPPVQEFLELEFPPITPLLGPIATQQIVMLYAPPGVGKTMLALALSHAIAAGKDFLGWTSAKRGRVLVIDGEMVGEMMQRRLAGAGLEDDWLRIANLSTWGAGAGYEPVNLCTEAGQQQVELWANACGADVLMLDNLMSLAWVDGLSMSSDEFWQPVRRFAGLQRALGRTVVIVDHTNAQGEIFGTKTKLWHADLAIQLSAMTSDEPRDGLSMTVQQTRFKLQFAKVRDGTGGTSSEASQAVQERVVTLGAVGQDWKWSGGREEQRQLAREMKLNGLTIRDIADELGISKSVAGRWVKGI